MLGELFVVFLKIGLLAFGGGYSVIAMIRHEATARGWLSDADFQNTVSIAGMAPGPVATNSATLVGYETAGIGGAVAATLGIVLPSLLLMIGAAAFLYRIHDSVWVKSSMYGLRPIVTGLILYAAIHFGLTGNGEPFVSWTTFATLAISGGALLALFKYKLHPLAVIAASGVAGIVLF
ncbi:chromate transporter [Paenibacillus thailandensis]|uniref:Chromate transporter n=1 Tax=Paenibacillus thailandensis TaxID=393250 RepID=A0ABW5R488_9BACL